MKPFTAIQDQMIDHVLEYGGCGLYSKPGSGKSRAMLEAMTNTPGRKLVVAPHLVCKSTWPAENAKWGYDFEMPYLHGKRKVFEDFGDVSLINYEGLPWLAESIRKHGNPFTSIVYDEVSKMKHPGTSRFRKWRSIMMDFTYRVGMTGSPMGNRLDDLFGETFVYDGGAALGTRKDEFLLKYFIQVREHTWRPIHGAKEIIFEKLKPEARAWEQDDAALPPITHNKIWLDLPASVRRWYDELHDEGVIEDLDILADNDLVVKGKQRQMAAGSMYDPEGNVIKLHTEKKAILKNLIDEQAGEPMLVVMEFAHDLDAIQEAAKGLRVGVLNGKTSVADQERYLDQWNAGELDILAFHPLSAGYGLNLQGVSSTIVFYTCPWSLELVEQSFRRLWRMGQEKKVTVHYLAMRGTIEEHVLAGIDRKEADQDALFSALA